MVTKLYVGNLPYEYRERDLEDLFGKYGRLESVSMKQGFAFVEFDSSRDAEDAKKELDGRDCGGRRIRVDLATSRGEYRGGGGGGGDRGGRDEGRGGESRNLFIANIPEKLRQDDIEDFFSKYGKVANVKMLPQKHGNPALSAFVDFVDLESARDAHESTLVIDGQTLRSDYNKPRQPRGGDNRRDDYRRDDYRRNDRRDDYSSSRRYDERSRYDRRDDRGSRRRSYDRRDDDRSNRRHDDDRRRNDDRRDSRRRSNHSRSRSRSRSPARSPARSSPRRSRDDKRRSRSVSPMKNNSPSPNRRSRDRSGSPLPAASDDRRSVSRSRSPIMDDRE